MLVVYSVIISFLFGVSDSNKVITKTNYFDNLDLKIKLNPRDILPKAAADKYAGVSSAISDELIDSIKLNAKNYIPTKISNNDIITIETSKGIMKLRYFSDI